VQRAVFVVCYFEEKIFAAQMHSDIPARLSRPRVTEGRKKVPQFIFQYIIAQGELLHFCGEISSVSKCLYFFLPVHDWLPNRKIINFIKLYCHQMQKRDIKAQK
jgi:hypothetical protein